jgi:hypothetical protein
MITHCQNCAQQIALTTEGRLPPWCSACGADLKAATPAPSPTPAAPAPSWEAEAIPEVVPVPQSTGKPWDGECCNACGAPVEVPDGADNAFVACPDCGQCLQAPPPWKPALPFLLAGCLANTKDRTKYPGWVGLVMGTFAITAVWIIPGVNPLLQCAATCLGGALLVEGLGRTRREARNQQPRRPAVVVALDVELPHEVDELGEVQGLYQTENNWDDSLAILLMALAIGFGGLYLLDWLEAGFISVKMIAAMVMAPVGALYMAYRALRNLYDRRRVLVFGRGLLYQEGNRVQVHAWDRVKEVTKVEINDAIDEEAVEIHVRNGLPPLRFTRAHFRNLHQFARRVQQLVAHQKAA